MQKFADATGLIVDVCHYPPGTSKWNSIEHCLFCHITRNWRAAEGGGLSIAATTGLEVHAWLDAQSHAKGRKVGDRELATCHINPHAYHGESNDDIHPHADRQIGDLFLDDTSDVSGSFRGNGI